MIEVIEIAIKLLFLFAGWLLCSIFCIWSEIDPDNDPDNEAKCFSFNSVASSTLSASLYSALCMWLCCNGYLW